MAQQPNPYRQQPVRRKPVQLNLPGASVTPAAQPVDTYYRTNAIAPRQSNSLLQLAGALAPFSQSLGNYLSFEKDNMAKEATAQAEMDVNEMSAEELKAVATMSQEELKANPQFQGDVARRPDYYITMKLNAGKRLGDIAKQDLIRKHTEMQGELTDPTKEPDIAAAYGALREEIMGGFEGFYIQRGAAAAIDPQIEHLQQKTITARESRLVEENEENLVSSLTTEFTAAFADETLHPIEHAQLLGKSQAQLEIYKKAGGTDPQGKAWEAAERAAFELVADDMDGDEAMAFLDKLETSFGINGGALAAPGTKNHAKLLELRDKVERKAEQNRAKDSTDYFEKNRIATMKAEDVAHGFLNQNPAGTPLDDETKEAIYAVFEEEGLLRSAAESEIFRYNEAASSKDVETNEDAFIRFTNLLNGGGIIPEGMLTEALTDGEISRADFTSFNEKNERNLKTPKLKREQDTTWKLYVQNTTGDLNNYPEAVRIKLTNELASKKLLFDAAAETARNDPAAWEALMQEWSSTGAGSLSQQFKTDQVSSLEMRSSNSAAVVGSSREVAQTYNRYRAAVNGLAPDFPADFDKDQARKELGRYEVQVEKAWRTAVDEVTTEVSADPNISVEEINSKVAERLSDRFGDLMDEALKETKRSFQEAEVAATGGTLASIVGRDEDSLLGIDEALETGSAVGRWDSVDMMQSVREAGEALISPRVNQELLQEQRQFAEEHSDYADGAIEALTEFLVTGEITTGSGRVQEYTLGEPFVELRHGGDQDSDERFNFPGRFSEGRIPATREAVVSHLRATWAFKGLPAEQIASQGLEAALGASEGKGLAPDDIDLGQMRLDLNQTQLESWMSEYDQTLTGPVGSKVTTNATKDTKMWKLMEALDIPIMYDGKSGKEDHSVHLIVQRQRRHLGIN